MLFYLTSPFSGIPANTILSYNVENCSFDVIDMPNVIPLNATEVNKKITKLPFSPPLAAKLQLVAPFKSLLPLVTKTGTLFSGTTKVTIYPTKVVIDNITCTDIFFNIYIDNKRIIHLSLSTEYGIPYNRKTNCFEYDFTPIFNYYRIAIGDPVPYLVFPLQLRNISFRPEYPENIFFTAELNTLRSVLPRSSGSEESEVVNFIRSNLTLINRIVREFEMNPSSEEEE